MIITSKHTPYQKDGKWHIKGFSSVDTYDTIVSNLNSKTPFCFSRWGDGELNAIVGKQGHNCDGHEYFPDMGKRLKDIFYSNPNYMMGIGSITVKYHRDKLPDYDWHHAAALPDASIKDRMVNFRAVLMDRFNVIMIGNSDLSPLPFIDNMIHIPEVNAWTQYDDALSLIKMFIDDSNIHPVILLSCGMMAGIMIDDLYNKYGNDITCIDTGSVLDPYVNKKTRGYHHKMDMNK